ncbi:MAG: hypothetical protein M5U09_18855 [Gammaproteobacteria bacterium]|nr:hypothetical protein [Gammaproteobacteria bacterium]
MAAARRAARSHGGHPRLALVRPAGGAERIQRVVRFAKQNPDKFDVYEVPLDRQVQFKDTGRFYRNIETFPVDFREADMVIIWGYREDEKRTSTRSSSMMIDPVDGFPIIPCRTTPGPPPCAFE